MGIASRNRRSAGFSLVETLCVLVLLGILLGIGLPQFYSYRQRTHVNRAVELFEALASRAREEARATGAPLPAELTSGGPPAAVEEVPPDSPPLALRLSKRMTPNGELRILSEREIGGSASLRFGLTGWGQLDPAEDSLLTGVFLELVPSQGDGTSVACLAVDLNGEFVFSGELAEAAFAPETMNYQRISWVNRRGAIRKDRR